MFKVRGNAGDLLLPAHLEPPQQPDKPPEAHSTTDKPEEDYTGLLEIAGYQLHVREPGWNEHRQLRGPDNRVNLHVFSQVDRSFETMRSSSATGCGRMKPTGIVCPSKRL